MKIKTKPQIALTAITAVITMTFANPVIAEEDHGHDDHKGHAHEKKIAGPNGGRVLTKVEPHLEFFVTKDHKIQITAVDDKGRLFHWPHNLSASSEEAAQSPLA